MGSDAPGLGVIDGQVIRCRCAAVEHRGASRGFGGRPAAVPRTAAAHQILCRDGGGRKVRDAV